jgi:hypothetical protein
VGYVEPKGACAEDLKLVLSTKLLELQSLVQPDGLLAEKCVGQAYDGAAVNRGNRGGLHVLMNSVFENAQFTWCWAHRLQLVCIASCSFKPELAEFFDVVNQIVTFFTSAIRHSCLEEVQKEIQVSVNNSNF